MNVQKIKKFILGCSTTLFLTIGIAYSADKVGGQAPAITNVDQEKGSRLAGDALAPIAGRIGSLETAVNAFSSKLNESTKRSAIYALLTVLITSIVSVFIQVMFMRHQRFLANAQTKAEISSARITWELQQLSELYGPLRALLGQSNAMYRQMNYPLINADPSQFRMVAGGDFDGKVFEINESGAWVRFRTVHHLSRVYGQNYGIEPYFDDLIMIGERMAKLIENKAGFARSDQNELVVVMGKYLAHYAMLRRVHERAKDTDKDVVPEKVDVTAAFPVEIQSLVNDGFLKINKLVDEWSAKAG